MPVLTSVHFLVPGPPVATNAGYKPARWGKRHGLVLTDQGEAYKTRLRIAAQAAWSKAGRPRALAERVIVGVRFGFKTNANDVDGPLKFALDSLAPRLIVNDNRITRVVIEKTVGEPGTRVAVASALAPCCPSCGCNCGAVMGESHPLDTPAHDTRERT
jgi:Holliday junction resolvase RusA-like endonuclease